jgi:BirA family transcriptional regulator, biotin operon repressor / biotin---[acetyl-CoA-carboxylase] ligase
VAGWPTGYDRHVHDTLDTTFSEAARIAPGLTRPAWILALEQTAARGRRGRPWATPRGNFAATLVVPRSEPPAQSALRSFVTSLALWRAFAGVTGLPQSFALKWPNDVLLEGGKVAGILLESSGDRLSIGVGVNLAYAPRPDEVEPGAVTPVSLRGSLGVQVTPEAFLDRLAGEYAELDTVFVTQGFAPIRAAWLGRAARLGEQITARTMRDSTTGIFEDVDTSGNLILGTDRGPKAIAAAEVFF